MKKIFFAVLLGFTSAQPALAQISIDHSLGGVVIVGQTTDSCNNAQSQALRWSSVNNTIEMCDGGGTWRKIVASSGTDTPPAPSNEIGYFVLSYDLYDGNMGGIQGANAICLSQLTTYNWRGKADAQARNLLNDTNVKAWLCNGSGCQNLNAWQIYQFAVANDPNKGGATISVEDDALTHNNTQNWSGENYWGHAAYFTGRESGSATKFGATMYGPCGGWDDNSTSGSNYGAVGSSYNSDSKRWRHIHSSTCSNFYRLACIVHP